MGAGAGRQVRDMTGDGKVMKRRLRDGRGEFPVDCPIEDSTVRVHFRCATAPGQPPPPPLPPRVCLLCVNALQTSPPIPSGPSRGHAPAQVKHALINRIAITVGLGAAGGDGCHTASPGEYAGCRGKLSRRVMEAESGRQLLDTRGDGGAAPPLEFQTGQLTASPHPSPRLAGRPRSAAARPLCCWRSACLAWDRAEYAARQRDGSRRSCWASGKRRLPSHSTPACGS